MAAFRGTLFGVRAKGQTRESRTFWWDRESRTGAEELRAVIFDADTVLAGIDDDSARTELIDAVMSLFVAGVWVSVVSTRPREEVATLVRHLLGDGLVETIVTFDDLPESEGGLPSTGELYRLALWEMGLTSRDALAVTGGLASAGMPTVQLEEPLSAASCQQAHRRWWIRQAASCRALVPVMVRE